MSGQAAFRGPASLATGVDERRTALLAAKLRALVGPAAGEAPVRAVPFALGVGAWVGDDLWALVDRDGPRALGPALAWSRQHGAARLHVVVDDGEAAGHLARRARLFTRPPAVWAVEHRTLVPAEPRRPPADPPLAPAVAPLAHLLRRAGVDPVVEHGTLRGEILGLEIARAVVDGDGPRLEVGVGRHDREAFALVHGHLPPFEALAQVVGHVRRFRHPGAAPHPLNRLAPERWLRSLLLAEPHRVGAARLAAVAPALPAADLRARQPAPAVGADPAGDPVVVACSTGVDLDLVPAAADARLAHAADAPLVLAVPAGDDHPVTRALAAELVSPAEVVPLPVRGHRFVDRPAAG